MWNWVLDITKQDFYFLEFFECCEAGLDKQMHEVNLTFNSISEVQ